MFEACVASCVNASRFSDLSDLSRSLWPLQSWLPV